MGCGLSARWGYDIDGWDRKGGNPFVWVVVLLGAVAVEGSRGMP